MKTETMVLIGVGALLLLNAKKNQTISAGIIDGTPVTDVTPSAIAHSASDYLSNANSQTSDALIAITDQLKAQGASNLDVYNALVSNYNSTLPSTIISTIPPVIATDNIISNYSVSQAVRDNNGMTATDRVIAQNKLSQTPAQQQADKASTALATAYNKAHGL
jgi:hypothetical protein